jgi:hypothetical protein
MSQQLLKFRDSVTIRKSVSLQNIQLGVDALDKLHDGCPKVGRDCAVLHQCIDDIIDIRRCGITFGVGTVGTGSVFSGSAKWLLERDVHVWSRSGETRGGRRDDSKSDEGSETHDG